MGWERLAKLNVGRNGCTTGADVAHRAERSRDGKVLLRRWSESVSAIFHWTPCFTFVFFLLSSIYPIFLLFSYPSPSATSQMSALTSKWQSMWNTAKRTRLQTSHLRLSVAHLQPLSSTTCLLIKSVVFCTIFDRGCCRWSKTPRGAERVGLFSDDSDDGRHEWRLPQQAGGKKDPPNAKQRQSAGTQWPWAAWPGHSRSAHTHFVSLTFTLECWHSLAFCVRMSWWHRHHIYLP